MKELIELTSVDLGDIIPVIRIQYQPIHETQSVAIAHLDFIWAAQTVRMAVNRFLYSEDFDSEGSN